MTDLDFDTTWQNVLTDIKDRSKVPSFRTWFEKSSLENIKGELAEINLSSAFAISYVQSHFEDVIKEVLSEHVGSPIKKITYSESKKQKKIKQFIDPDQPSLIDLADRQRVLVVEQVKTNSSSTLNDRYTFDTFIVGNSNRLAHAAAQAVSRSIGSAYNPLYIYGGVGLGKTHLMQAVGHEVLRQDPDKKILYVSCEVFLNELVSAIQSGSVDRFKKKYRNVDVFLVDDIQFIAGKETTQEEFFHTYNALHQTNKQIIITSDKPPQEIPQLEDRLASRFAAGMIADIQPPDLEMREAILQRKCIEQGKEINPKLIRLIAERVDSNIRELEGALLTVITDLEVNNQELNHDNIQQALNRLVQTRRKSDRPSVSLIKDIVCEFYRINHEEIISARRNKELVFPRQIFMFLLKTELSMSFPNIGKEVGGRDHTTVMYGVDKIFKELKKNSGLRDEVKEIKSRFYRI